jgi:hypothetical protein
MLELGTRVLTAFQLSQTAPTGKAFMDGLTSLWQALAANSQPDALGRITLEQFKQTAETVFTSAGGYDQTMGPLIEAGVGILDPDGDGVVGTDALTTLLEAVGAEPDHIPVGIQALDPDGNGTVTTDQLRTAAREFFTSTDQSAPGNAVFGQL